MLSSYWHGFTVVYHAFHLLSTSFSLIFAAVTAAMSCIVDLCSWGGCRTVSCAFVFGFGDVDSLAMIPPWCIMRVTCCRLLPHLSVILVAFVYWACRFLQLAIKASSMSMLIPFASQVTLSLVSVRVPSSCLCISFRSICSTLFSSTLDAMSASVFVLPEQNTSNPSKWYVNCRSSHRFTTSSISSIPDQNLLRQKHVGDESDRKITFLPCSLGPHVAAAIVTAHASRTAILILAFLIWSLHSPAK